LRHPDINLTLTREVVGGAGATDFRKVYRNNPAVRAMGSPAETGLRSLEYIRRRIGIDSHSGLEMLDLGCGSRFTDAIIRRNVPLKSYVGVDVYKGMIDFLAKHAKDPRLKFFHTDARNPSYNKDGVPLSVDSILPIAGRKSRRPLHVLGQLPEDSAVIFTLVRRHVRDNGRLFSRGNRRWQFRLPRAIPGEAHRTERVFHWSDNAVDPSARVVDRFFRTSISSWLAESGNHPMRPSLSA
jgi:SAM-dependent methyltransferase